jgi:hypothetical protein
MSWSGVIPRARCGRGFAFRVVGSMSECCDFNEGLKLGERACAACLHSSYGHVFGHPHHCQKCACPSFRLPIKLRGRGVW